MIQAGKAAAFNMGSDYQIWRPLPYRPRVNV